MTATSENHTCELSTMGTFQYVSVKNFTSVLKLQRVISELENTKLDSE
jgi:hypothetical protein